jgi:hypothetical protein
MYQPTAPETRGMVIFTPTAELARANFIIHNILFDVGVRQRMMLAANKTEVQGEKSCAKLFTKIEFIR